jgi:hypothetical protein
MIQIFIGIPWLAWVYNSMFDNRAGIFHYIWWETTGFMAPASIAIMGFVFLAW